MLLTKKLRRASVGAVANSCELASHGEELRLVSNGHGAAGTVVNLWLLNGWYHPSQ